MSNVCYNNPPNDHSGTVSKFTNSFYVAMRWTARKLPFASGWTPPFTFELTTPA